MHQKTGTHTGIERRALIVISDLEFGGAQRQVVELCNNMDRSRFDLHVCSLSDYVPLADSLRDKSRFHTVLRRSRYDASVVTRLSALAKQLNGCLLHAYLFDAQIASRLAGRIRRIPVIDSERNSDYTFKKSDFIAFKLTNWARDLTIANSGAGADFNSKALGLPRETYRVVHNGVDADRFQPRSGAEVRRELGVRDDELLVGVFGSFKPQKNHPFFLRAAKRIAADFPNVRFMLVGDELHKGGSDSVAFKQTIHTLVDELGLRNRIIFAGNRKDVERFYPVCDLTVLPSLFEGTPNVALESMACAVPVVATNVSDNSYVIPDAKAGYVIPLNDEDALVERVGRLLRSRDLRRALGDGARAWIMSEFTGQRLAEKTADVYEEALRLRARKH